MWHYKNLGDAMFADAELAKIKQLAMATNAPLYVKYYAKSGLHCEVLLYFSPHYQSLANLLGATCCKAPNLDELTVL